MDKYADLLGHYNTQCQGPNQPVVSICSDHVFDLFLCVASQPLSSIQQAKSIQELEEPPPQEVDFSVSHNKGMQEMLFQVFSSIRTWLTMHSILKTPIIPTLLTYTSVESTSPTISFSIAPSCFNQGDPRKELRGSPLAPPTLQGQLVLCPTQKILVQLQREQMMDFLDQKMIHYNCSLNNIQICTSLEAPMSPLSLTFYQEKQMSEEGLEVMANKMLFSVASKMFDEIA